jgi:hypothetical protein
LDQGKQPPIDGSCLFIYSTNVSVILVPTLTHATYQIKALPHNIKKYIFCRKVDPMPPLYDHEGVIGD